MLSLKASIVVWKISKPLYLLVSTPYIHIFVFKALKCQIITLDSSGGVNPQCLDKGGMRLVDVVRQANTQTRRPGLAGPRGLGKLGFGLINIRQVRACLRSRPETSQCCHLAIFCPVNPHQLSYVAHRTTRAGIVPHPRVAVILFGQRDIQVSLDFCPSEHPNP